MVVWPDTTTVACVGRAPVKGSAIHSFRRFSVLGKKLAFPGRGLALGVTVRCPGIGVASPGNHKLDSRSPIDPRKHRLNPGIVTMLGNLHQVPRLHLKEREYWHADTPMSTNQAVPYFGMVINLLDRLIIAKGFRLRIEFERGQASVQFTMTCV
jgi:hypothetical protein